MTVNPNTMDNLRLLANFIALGCMGPDDWRWSVLRGSLVECESYLLLP